MPDTDESSFSMPDLGDGVDLTTFSQILEMDESDEDRDFSKDLVSDFFKQARATFFKMDTAVDARNLNELSSLGHFLKGSSATLGFNKVRDSCQVIQQYGHKLTVDGQPENNEEKCIEQITKAIKKVKIDLDELHVILKRFYNDNDL